MLWRIACWSNTELGVSSKTGNKLSVSQMSAVLTHHHLSKHTISDSDFTILTSGNSKFDFEMRENLLISKLKPVLDKISPLWVGIKHGSGITEIRNCGSGKRDKTRKKG